MITDANLGVVNIGQLALSRLAIFEVSFNQLLIHVSIGGNWWSLWELHSFIDWTFNTFNTFTISSLKRQLLLWGSL